MDEAYTFRAWVLDNWMRAGLIAAIALLALLPLFWDQDELALLLTYVLLPLYMIHQYEEHAHGRFIADTNATIGRGYPVFTPEVVLVINIGAVWALFSVLFYLATYVELGLALIPAYLTAVNAVTHIIGTLVLRRYNPGLYTAVALFVPWSVPLIFYVSDRIDGVWLYNIIGLVIALAVHAAIMAYALHRRSRLEGAGPPGVAVATG
jgi:hypothetical protein